MPLMASTLYSFYSNSNIKLFMKRNTHHQAVQARDQSFRDEGRSSNIVDANLRVLRGRIEEVKVKERLERCCRYEYGWNYARDYDYKLKREAELSQLFQLAGIVGGTFGFTLFFGTVFLCLFSFLVNLN